MNKKLRCAVVLPVTAMLMSIAIASAAEKPDPKLKWFDEAKYGLFINWGLYSIPAGEWKGKKYPDRNIHQVNFPFHKELRAALADGSATRVEIPGKHIYLKCFTSKTKGDAA